MAKIIVKMNFDVGIFNSEEEVDKFLNGIRELADSQNKVLRDATAALMIAVEDLSDLPPEVQERLMKKNDEEKRDPKKYIN